MDRVQPNGQQVQANPQLLEQLTQELVNPAQENLNRTQQVAEIVKQLRAANAQMSQEVRNLQGRVQEVSAMFDTSKANLEKEMKAHQQQATLLTQERTKTERLAAEILSQLALIARQAEMIERVSNEKSAMSTLNQDLSQQVSSLGRELSAEKAETTQLKTTHAQLADSNRDLTAQVTELTGQLTTEQEKSGQLERANAGQANEITQLKATVAAYQAAMEQAKQAVVYEAQALDAIIQSAATAPTGSLQPDPTDPENK